jgi:hypothetical protein
MRVVLLSGLCLHRGVALEVYMGRSRRRRRYGTSNKFLSCEAKAKGAKEGGVLLAFLLDELMSRNDGKYKVL